jgi:hypothetical protein
MKGALAAIANTVSARENGVNESEAWCRTFFKDRLNGPSMYSISC